MEKYKNSHTLIFFFRKKLLIENYPLFFLFVTCSSGLEDDVRFHLINVTVSYYKEDSEEMILVNLTIFTSKDPERNLGDLVCEILLPVFRGRIVQLQVLSISE